MGLILDSNNFSDQLIDIVIIFILGALLLFFFNTMINHKRTFLITFSSYMIFLLLIMTIYINFRCKKENINEKPDTFLEIVNFMSVYTICVNLLLVAVIINNYVYINDDM